MNRLALAVENPATGVTPTSTCASGGGTLGGNWCQQFGYDVYGNRWVNTYGATPPINTPTSANNFDPGNHLIVNSAQPDLSGNLGQIGGSSGVQSAYDAENRLTTVTSLATSTTIAAYAYDGEGRRVQRASGATTTYVYDALGELAAEYVTGTAPAVPCTTCYLTADHLGSTRMMTDNQGSPVALHDFQPFGEEIPRSSPLYNQTDNPRQKFTGKERESELANSGDPYGLDFFGARYFSAVQGRFTSPDAPLADQHPRNPQSWNLFAYALNNPLSLVDPDGRAGVPACNANDSGCVQHRAEQNKRAGDIGSGLVKGTWNNIKSGWNRFSDIVSDVSGGRVNLGHVDLTAVTPDEVKGGGDASNAIVIVAPLFGETPEEPLNFDQAREQAFENAGMTDPSEVKFTKVDPETGTVVEFKGLGNAEVNYDPPHPDTSGEHHDTQHIGWHAVVPLAETNS